MKGLEPSTFCMARRVFAPVRVSSPKLRNLSFAVPSGRASERQRTRANAECSHCSHRDHSHKGSAVSKEEILAAYPDLETEDIEQALRYAAEAVRERQLPIAGQPLAPR